MTIQEKLIVRTEVEASPIAFIDLKAQQALIKDRVDSAIQRVLAHGRYIAGPEIDWLETELAKRTGAADVVGVASGTDALVIPLIGEGIGHGDAVFIPAFTYNATANAVLMTGATPVFVDTDPSTFNMDPDDLLEKIEQVEAEGKLKARAIVAVDLFGMPADYAMLSYIADGRGMFLMADAAQSFGGSQRGVEVGALAPVSATSFFPSKTLGCYGDGGAIFTTDSEKADLWRSIRFHGTDDQRKESLRVGMNGRLDTIQAAILIEKLKIFDEELKVRNNTAEIYHDRLSERLALTPRNEDDRSSYGLFSALARDTEDRAKIQEHLKMRGVPTAIYYTTPLHKHRAFEAYAPEGGLPVCEDASTRIFALPMHPYLSEDQVHHICDAVLEMN
jgi:UDP-2-acetamido-2-deoxy-ribo-hexuluronate aminotransferase